MTLIEKAKLTYLIFSAFVLIGFLIYLIRVLIKLNRE